MNRNEQPIISFIFNLNRLIKNNNIEKIENTFS